MLTKFVLKTDYSERLANIEREIWEELALKLEKKAFERRCRGIEEEADAEKKRTNKDLGTIREVCDRMRRKTDENVHALIEVKSEQDQKMSAKEGQKLWANFRKYAQYDELKELYRKTMPAISSFEDKLKKNNDHNEKIDEMMRRLDEVICSKSDRQALKEYREYVTENYLTRVQSEEIMGQTGDKIKEFGGRVDEVENMVKF